MKVLPIFLVCFISSATILQVYLSDIEKKEINSQIDSLKTLVAELKKKLDTLDVENHLQERLELLKRKRILNF